MLFVSQAISIPLRELHFSYVRSSGPGGQNVNKLNTKATLRWNVTRTPSLPDAVKSRFLKAYAGRISKDGSLIITSQRFRDRGRNVADCLAKLRTMILAVEEAQAIRRPTRATRASQQRRLQEKRQHAEKKQARKSIGRDD